MSLFAVHPILVESVAWLSGMPYALSAMLFLFSFFFYINSRNNSKYYYFSLLFFLATLNTNDKAISLFLIFVFWEFCFGSLKNAWKKTVPYFAVSFVWMAMSVLKIGYRIQSIDAVSYSGGQNSGLYNPLVQVPIAIANYLKLIFWPEKLTLYHTDVSFTQIQFVIIYIVFLAFLGILFYSFKKNRSVFFWLSFFLITLLPVLTPFKIAWIVAERYAYLGTLGIIVPVAMFFDWTARKYGAYKTQIYAGFALIILALSARTIARNGDWKNEDNLWLATAKVDASGQSIHNNLGDVYSRQGDFPKAAEEFQKAIEINPNYGDAYHNLANTYKAMGKNDLAIENYQKALKINPNLWQSYQNLAAIYFDKGDYQKSLEYIQKAIAVNPQDESLKSNLETIKKKASQQ